MSEALTSIEVSPQWVDYNGHMNDAEYARVFSLAVEALSDAIGLDAEGRTFYATTLYTLETHVCFLREAMAGDKLQVAVDVLDCDAKRLHVFFHIRDKQDALIATSEQMLMAMSTKTGRPQAFPEQVTIAIDHLSHLEPSDWPVQAGQKIRIRRK